MHILGAVSAIIRPAVYAILNKLAIAILFRRLHNLIPPPSTFYPLQSVSNAAHCCCSLLNMLLVSQQPRPLG